MAKMKLSHHLLQIPTVVLENWSDQQLRSTTCSTYKEKTDKKWDQTVNTNLTWGRLFSRLREIAPEPHPTSRHVRCSSAPTPAFSRSLSTSSTNSCTNTQRKHSSGFIHMIDCFHSTFSFSSPVQPQFQALVWTQEVSSSASDLWSPTPRSHTAQAFYTKHTYLWTLSVRNIWVYIHMEVAHVETSHLERRLVHSCHICSVFSRLSNSVNFPCSRLSI